MIIKGRAISNGIAKGKVVKVDEPFGFLGGVDPSTGDLLVADGENIAGKVFVFPHGKGSTVGSFVMYDLLVHGNAPAAIVNRSAETIVTTGAVISSIPMVDSVDTDLLRDGDIVYVNGTDGTISLEVPCTRAASAAVMVGDRFLILQRPDDADVYPGRHSLVAGKLERGETPAEAAAREVLEETGLLVGEPDDALKPLFTRDGDRLWEVSLFLYRLDAAEPVLNSENTGFFWKTLEEILDDPLMAGTTAGNLARLMRRG